MRAARRAALLVAWIAVLAAAGWFIQRNLTLGTDLRLFLPEPQTPQERLLLEEIGEGPASRILTVALQGAPAELLAELSRALVAALQGDARFRFAANGETSLDALPDDLLAYRYLLSPTLDTQSFTTDFLRDELAKRARDLSSPAGSFLEPWLPRDPTLELLAVLETWRSMQEPRREFDVWFDRAGERALLLVETRAPAFDPGGQRAALQALETAFEEVRDGASASMTISGAGKFSVLMEERTRGDAQRLGALASLGMIVLLLLAYRRIEAVLISLLPLASAVVAGLGAVAALFDAVHGITLAFGFTLIGVAQDYPIHLLSHRRAGRTGVEVARELWPTLATGVASTCLAYLTFLFAGVVGLQQLAWFTVAGLLAAALTTRFALPWLLGPDERAGGDFIARVQLVFDQARRPGKVLAALLAAAALVVVAAPQPFWENDLSKLTPVPRDLLEENEALRAELGAPDVRYLLAIEAADAQAALGRLEGLTPQLDRLVEAGAISGFDHAARYTPPASTQLRRQARLPEPQTLRATLAAASADSPFRADAFEPFVADVARAREAPPLTPAALAGTPLQSSIEMLLNEQPSGAVALVTFSGVTDAAVLAAFAAQAGAGVQLLDLKDASESLVARQRERILWSLAVAAALLTALVFAALRSLRRVVRVVLPMAMTTLLVLAVLRAGGVSLNLFHLIALVLAAGLGLDYALFFERAAHEPEERRRTLHAILVCACSTLLVFVLLATSSLPVLQAIGVTVSLGVFGNFVLALLIAQNDRSPGTAAQS